MEHKSFLLQKVAKTTAKTFLEELRPSNPQWHFRGNWSSDWLFRGHGSEKWELLPSAWRSDNRIISDTKLFYQRRMRYDIEARVQERLIDLGHKLENVNQTIFERVCKILLQAYSEYILIQEFLDRLNSFGYQIPDNREFGTSTTEFFREYLTQLLPQKGAQSPDTSNFAIWKTNAVAVAQHHGIPTRLIDWTTNPLIAAYFAAESAVSKGRIAVLAVPRFFFRNAASIHSVPRSVDTYIHAQEGLFSFDHYADRFYLDLGEYRPLNESVNQISTIFPSLEQVPRMFTLPSSQVGELFRLLWHERVTRAHLMPTYDNVVHSLKTKWRYVIEKHNSADTQKQLE